MSDKQASLAISQNGTFFLDTHGLLSPQWLERNGWVSSHVRLGQYAAKATASRFRRLREQLGDERLVLDLSAAAWLVGQNQPVVDAEQFDLDLSSLDERLMPHQLRTIEWMLQHSRGLISPDPGLGKTAISLSASRLLPPGHVMVVCPVTLMRNWAREIRMWVPSAEIVIWHGDDIEKQSYGDGPRRRYVIINYDTLVRKAGSFEERAGRTAPVFVPNPTIETLLRRFQALIVDESLMIKNRNARRSQVLAAVSSWVPVVWELSGSPAGRYYDDVWHQMHVLSPKMFSSYWQFAYRYCQIEKNQWGTSIVGNADGADTKLRRDLVDWYYPLSYADSGLEIPEWIFVDERVTLTGRQWGLYRQMHQDFMMELEATDDEPEGSAMMVPIVVTKLLRLMQIASNPALIGGVDMAAKWAYLAIRLEYTEGPVIVWTSFVESANRLKKLLAKGRTVEVLTGETPQGRRQGIVDQFQSGNIDVLICHPGVGKFGLTLTRARTAIYLERGWNGDDYYQSLYRIRRIGTTQPPTVIHLLACGPDDEPTVDDAVHARLDYRYRAARALSKEQVRRALTVRPTVPSAPIAPQARTQQAAPATTSATLEQPSDTARGLIRPGYYTVLLPAGGHRTVRVSKWVDPKDEKLNRVCYQLLVGADNTTDYQSFAHQVEGEQPRIWGRFRSDGAMREVLDLLLREDPSESGHEYALRSGRCYRCNRLLTVPASLHRGMGPDCAGKE